MKKIGHHFFFIFSKISCYYDLQESKNSALKVMVKYVKKIELERCFEAYFLMVFNAIYVHKAGHILVWVKLLTIQ